MSSIENFFSNLKLITYLKPELNNNLITTMLLLERGNEL